MRRFDLKSAAISLSICAVIALIVSRFSRLPFMAAFLIVVGAMLLNGLIATYEDDMPGGFNNPDGKLISPFIATVNRVISWIPMGAAVLLAVCVLIWPRGVLVAGIALGVVAAILAWTISIKFSALAQQLAAAIRKCLYRPSRSFCRKRRLAADT